MEEIKENKKINYFMILIIISCLVVIAAAFYFYFFKKDFDFIVEVPCNTEEVCFIRNCSFTECPPNEFSSFKRYALKASDFKFCENENCELACEASLINCELIPCEENMELGESCSVLPSFNNLENLENEDSN